MIDELEVFESILDLTNREYDVILVDPRGVRPLYPLLILICRSVGPIH